MKNRVLLFLLLAFPFAGMAQGGGNLAFFTDRGEPFYVFLNNIKQNDKADAHVRITGIAPTTYRLKLVFANSSLPVVSDNIVAMPFKEKTFIVRKVVVSKKGVKPVKTAYKVKLYSMENIMPDPTPILNPQGQPELQNPGNNPAYQSAPTNGNLTPTPGNNQPANSSLPFGIQPNVNGGVNFGLGNGWPGVSVTFNSGQLGAQPCYGNPGNVGVPPGYGTPPPDYTMQPTYPANPQNPQGYTPYGCAYPMNPYDFSNALQSIASKSFEDTKLTIAKQILSSNCLTAAQVKQVMQKFSFESTKLDFAKFAFGRTVDRQNYFQLNDAFEFESSITELNQYIQQH